MADRPDIFTLTFWETTTARVAHYAAIGASNLWGIGAIGAHTQQVSIPAWCVAIGALLCALWGVTVSAVGGRIPGSVIRLAALFPAPNQRLEVRVRAAGRPETGR